MKRAGAVTLLLSSAFAQTPQHATLDSAMAAEKAGRTVEAVRQFRELLKAASRPEIAGQARLELVRIYEGRGQWWESAEQLRELRKLAPKDPEYAYLLGVSYRNLSKQSFERMQTVAPAGARTQQMFGEQYSLGGETEKAVAAYQQAIAADPKLAGSHLALALIYMRQGRRDDARSEIGKELEIAPESALARQVQQAILGGSR